MPQSSHRISSLLGGDADGWTVFYRARRMKEAGVPVLELTIGEHDIGTDAAILDEMHRAAQAGHTGYAAVPGIPALRDKIAERLAEATGLPMTRDNVLVTPGGQAGLFRSPSRGPRRGSGRTADRPLLHHLSRHDPRGRRPPRPGGRASRTRVSAKGRGHCPHRAADGGAQPADQFAEQPDRRGLWRGNSGRHRAGCRGARPLGDLRRGL